MDGVRAISRAVAIAGVVVVDAGGGGEVRRVGFSGGDGAKISLGGGGATRIYVNSSATNSVKILSSIHMGGDEGSSG